MKERQYYHLDNSEFPSGLGALYTEFIGQVATRQISPVNGSYYASSSLEDYHPDVGYLLYDGLKDDLDLSSSRSMTKDEFDSLWSASISRQEKENYLHYHTGNAAIPLQSPILIIHIVNGQGKWGKGFILALSKRYSEAEKSYLSWSKDLQAFELGNVDFYQVDPFEKVYMGNMLAQEYIKRNKYDQNQYLSYENLKKCLSKVADFALVNRLSVQCPLIGSGLAGGDWNLISEILIEYICSKKIHCHVVKLDK